MASDLIAIGAIGRAVGLEGFCMVEPFGTTLARLRVPVSVFVGTNDRQNQQMVIDDIRPRQRKLLCRFQGRHDRDLAEALCQNMILAERTMLPKLGPDELYHFELVGMSVISDQDSRCIGTVREVHSYPTADTVEVETEDRGRVLLPLTDAVIERVDKMERIISVRFAAIKELFQASADRGDAE